VEGESEEEVEEEDKESRGRRRNWNWNLIPSKLRQRRVLTESANSHLI
jgi:hypothetical protein